ncbi:MAG: alpha-amylase domain-containing protein [Bacteroidota bacterium]
MQVARRLYLTIFLLIAIAVPAFTANPWNGKVVLQAFWWDYTNNNYPNGWYNYLADLAPRLRGLGIDAVWIPPTIKNGGTNSVGYSPFDQYDLGDKYQKGNVKTRLGTKDEYLRMVAVMHANGIDVIQDIVLNHMNNAGSTNGSGGQDPAAANGDGNLYKNFRYTSYATPATTDSAADYLARSGRWPKNWQNFHANPAHNSLTGDWNVNWFGPDICYYSGAYGQSSNATYNPIQSSNYMRTNTRNWLIWYKKQTGFDGVRIDAAKHFPWWATQDFLHNLKYEAGWASGGANMFAVGEIVGSGADQDAWINNVRYSNGGSEDMVGTFDFGLRQELRNMIGSGGGYNLANIPGSQQGNRYRTVPFVNNHDTFRPIKDANGNYIGWDSGNELGGGHIDPSDGRIQAAYAIACAVDGSPQIFFEDLFNIGTTSKRYTHLPTSTTNLPERDAIKNIIWCHQKLDFKAGAYHVRYQSADLLIIERNAKAIIGVNDHWTDWKNAYVQTGFAPGTQLHDYSGANSNDIWVDGSGKVTIWVPPCNGSNTRRGYAIWGPAGKSGGFNPTQRTTTQEWEMSNDLGDSHASSLQQGGALPAGSTAERYSGKVFSEANKSITVNIYPDDITKNVTINLYNTAGTNVKTVSGVGDITLSYTPTATGFYRIKIKNTSASNPAQTVYVKATYTSPKVPSTASYPAKYGVLENERYGENLSMPMKTELYQNYPNPFNPSTAIRFTMAEEGNVSIKVYDMLGKEVSSVTEGYRPAGVYDVEWNAGTMASGIYFYMLRTGTHSETKKLMLMK